MMWFMRAPTPRRVLIAAYVALSLGIALVVAFVGFSDSYPIRLIQQIAIAAGIFLVLGWIAATIGFHIADYKDPASEEEFDRIVERAERLAADGLAADPDEEDFLALDPHDRDDFDELVRDALDDLPRDFQLVLKHVAVVVSDDGRKRGAYGLYHGDGAHRDNYPDRIIIYRDTLVRDFGHDPDLLRAQVTRTVLHELAHHLGWDEPGVRGLGL